MKVYLSVLVMIVITIVGITSGLNLLSAANTLFNLIGLGLLGLVPYSFILVYRILKEEYYEE